MARLLIFFPFGLMPLRGGGALRSFHLLNQLARRHEVHAIVFQKEAELRRETDGYRFPPSVRVYSPLDCPAPRVAFDLLPPRLGKALHSRWLRRTLRGPACGILLQSHHLVRQVLTSRKIDAAILVCLDPLSAVPLLRRHSPRTIRILDAFNVEHKLCQQELAAKYGENVPAAARKMLADMRWKEENLRRLVHGVWTCSEQDRKDLAPPGGVPGFLVPNGVDSDFYTFDENSAKAETPVVLFTGWLGTVANDDGVRFLLDDIWPRILKSRSDLRLRIAGGGASAQLRERIAAAPQVDYAGEVPDVRPHFKRAGVAMVPLRIGSGTRLKILEAMSQGNPVVSTRLGAEGLDVTEGEDIFLADDPDGFAGAVLRLVEDRRLFERVRRTARALVESRYDWSVIGALAHGSLSQLLERDPGSRPA